MLIFVKCLKFFRHIHLLLYGLVLFASQAAQAVTLYGLIESSKTLVTFDSASPGTIITSVAITGSGTDYLQGLDIRPANQELYTIVSNSTNFRLATINKTTGALSFIGPATALPNGAFYCGIAIDPILDQLRTLCNGSNYRFNLDSGALIANDVALAYVPGDSQVGTAFDYVNHLAYDKVQPGGSTAYAIHTNFDKLLRLGGVSGSPSANTGDLTTIGALGVDAALSGGFVIDMASGVAYAALNVGGGGKLYTINLSTGAATLVGQIGTGAIIDGLAMAQPSLKNRVDYFGPSVTIPDNSLAGVNINIPVTGVGQISTMKFLFTVGPDACNATVGNLNAGVTHTFIGDLTFNLTSPAGTTTTFQARRGGTRENICLSEIADSNSPNISTQTSVTGSPQGGNFGSEVSGQLSVFNGQNANGTWVLNVSDAVIADTGSVNRFALIFTKSDIVPDTISFPTQTNQVLSSVSASAPARILGVTTSTNISWSPVSSQVLVSSTNTCSGASAIAQGGSVPLNSYICVRHTNSASNNTTTTTSLTLGDFAGSPGAGTAQWVSFSSTTVPDIVPNNISFPTQTNQVLSSISTSAPAQILGVTANTNVFWSPASSQVLVSSTNTCAGASTLAQGGSVPLNSYICVRHTNSASNNTTTTTSLTLGDFAGSPGAGTAQWVSFSSTTVPDIVPNNISFPTQTNQALSSVSTSVPAQILGVTSNTNVYWGPASSQVLVSSANTCAGASVIAQGGSVPLNSYICVRHTNSASNNTTTTTSLTLGDFAGSPGAGTAQWVSFSSTTLPDIVPDAISFTPQTNRPLGSVSTSLPALISGVTSSTNVYWAPASSELLISATNDCATAIPLSQGSIVLLGRFICVRHTNSASPNTTTTTSLTLGDPAGNPSAGTALWTSFSSTTVAAVSPPADSDDDNDSMPYAVEIAEGRNPAVKDNAIFAGMHPNSDRWFAMQQYRDFLAREGDVGGITSWTNALNNNSQDRAQVVRGFFDSAEFQNQFAPLSRLYLAYFNRFPDYGGLIGWVAQRKAGMSIEAVSQNFATSVEFTNRYGSVSNADFVNLCYQNVLGRAPDNEGFINWLNVLNSNTMTRGQVMLQFAESQEFKNASYNEVAVTMAYVGLLRRSPETAGFNSWLNFLDGGSSVNSMLSGFIGSAEYRNRFLP